MKLLMKKKIVLWTGQVAGILAVPPLYIVKNIFGITLWRMRCSRIGHLAANTELFSRRLQLAAIPGKKHLVLALDKPCNEQLFSMFRRNLSMFTIPLPKPLRAISKVVATNSLASTLGLFLEMPFSVNEYAEFSAQPTLSFTDAENAKGKELLKQLGVQKWFVCLHARDAAYLNKQWKGGDSYHEFRNCSIENYVEAAKYVVKQGGVALRMGAAVEKPLESKVRSKKIIDYAVHHRSDFGDIYLSAKCKFFLGNTAGLYDVATIFSVPVAIANVIPLNYPPLRSTDLFIPKKIWSERQKRFLTFREMLNSEIIDFLNPQEYTNAGLTPHENSPEEILDLAIEMNGRLDGTWKSSPEDEALQQKFKSLFGTQSRCYGFPSRIGAKFLRENKDLLE